MFILSYPYISYYSFTSFYPAALGILLIVNFSLFKKEHLKAYAIDYTIETLFRRTPAAL